LKISDIQLIFQNKIPDKNYEKFFRLILHTAKQHMPKGKTPKYKQFLPDLLTQLRMIKMWEQEYTANCLPSTEHLPTPPTLKKSQRQ
jgi:hypothetical protein